MYVWLIRDGGRLGWEMRAQAHLPVHTAPVHTAQVADSVIYISTDNVFNGTTVLLPLIVQELCESRGGRPGLSVLTSLLASVDVKIY